MAYRLSVKEAFTPPPFTLDWPSYRCNNYESFYWSTNMYYRLCSMVYSVSYWGLITSLRSNKMRVNIYAEEMTDRVEIFEKEIDGNKFEACRFYLYLPTTYNGKNIQGPFIHKEDDDDSAAITFWSRGKLRGILQKAIDLLDAHHAKKSSDARDN